MSLGLAYGAYRKSRICAVLLAAYAAAVIFRLPREVGIGVMVVVYTFHLVLIRGAVATFIFRRASKGR